MAVAAGVTAALIVDGIAKKSEEKTTAKQSEATAWETEPEPTAADVTEARGRTYQKIQGCRSLPVEVARRWAIVVGVSEYADSRVPALRYAARDAREFAGWLTSPDGGGYAPADVKLLVNEDATAKNVRDALFNWSRNALPEDMLTIYFACHGSPESPDARENLYLLPYDTDWSNVASTAFPMWDVKTALERFVKAGHVVVLADVCHAGGVGEAFEAGRRGVAGLGRSMVNDGVSGLSEVTEGVLVFTSARGGQLSREGRQWGGGHGVFTHFLLEGLEGEADYNSDSAVTLGELVPYVQEKVRRATRDAQTPEASGRFATDLTLAGGADDRE